MEIMQNIKVCPKCNQVATEQGVAFCPFDGTPLVEMQAIQNQQAQQPPVNQPQIPTTPTAEPKKLKLPNPFMVGCFGLILIAMVLGFVNFIRVGSNSSNPNSSESNMTNAVATPTQLPPPSTLSSKENLEWGKKLLYENTDAAKYYLSNIPKGTKEYSSAQRTLIELELEDLAKNEKALDELSKMSRSMDETYGTRNMEQSRQRMAEIQTRRRELERKLKSLP